jgi:hypothetical protein
MSPFCSLRRAISILNESSRSLLGFVCTILRNQGTMKKLSAVRNFFCFFRDEDNGTGRCTAFKPSTHIACFFKPDEQVCLFITRQLGSDFFQELNRSFNTAFFICTEIRHLPSFYHKLQYCTNVTFSPPNCFETTMANEACFNGFIRDAKPVHGAVGA